MALTKQQLSKLRDLQLANIAEKIAAGRTLTPREQGLLDEATGKDGAKNSRKEFPDREDEKALYTQSIRRRSEIALEKDLGRIVEVEKILLPLVGLGKLTVSRMLQIPDRVCSRFAERLELMRKDESLEAASMQQIKADLEKEIRNALRVLSETEIKRLVKEAKEQ